ncbi:hypothetical protein C2845_PM07G19700 [Panicum miliaceum]|uniref:Uncharacterized protein n=1 Tax=Panicum miliaceum TaxID=4540 RepID=A0A3L6SR91_PANMI|nr:hypothetical protein C2845_PM07G19700 [Panicum miliaceum]
MAVTIAAATGSTPSSHSRAATTQGTSPTRPRPLSLAGAPLCAVSSPPEPPHRRGPLLPTTSGSKPYVKSVASEAPMLAGHLPSPENPSPRRISAGNHRRPDRDHIAVIEFFLGFFLQKLEDLHVNVSFSNHICASHRGLTFFSVFNRLMIF